MTSCQKLTVFKDVGEELPKEAIRSKKDIYSAFRFCGTMVVGEKNHMLLSSGLQGTQSPQGESLVSVSGRQ